MFNSSWCALKNHCKNATTPIDSYSCNWNLFRKLYLILTLNETENWSSRHPASTRAQISPTIHKAFLKGDPPPKTVSSVSEAPKSDTLRIGGHPTNPHSQRQSSSFWLLDTIKKWRSDDEATFSRLNGNARTATLQKMRITHNLTDRFICLIEMKLYLLETQTIPMKYWNRFSGHWTQDLLPTNKGMTFSQLQTLCEKYNATLRSHSIKI